MTNIDALREAYRGHPLMEEVLYLQNRLSAAEHNLERLAMQPTSTPTRALALMIFWMMMLFWFGLSTWFLMWPVWRTVVKNDSFSPNMVVVMTLGIVSGAGLLSLMSAILTGKYKLVPGIDSLNEVPAAPTPSRGDGL